MSGPSPESRVPSPDKLPRPFGASVLRARMRTTPDDFVVDERLGFAPDGTGEHLFLRVRKRGANTAFVARELARWANVDERGIGYAGMKDRHAVTTQSFSLHLPGRHAPSEWPEHPEFSVIEAARHGRKLPRGALAGNYFELTLREVDGQRAAIEARLQLIAEQGFANYFGEQRFGHDGGNLAAAQRMFDGQRVKREQRGILLSAARSSLFNVVLAARVANGSWAAGMDGEVWMLDGSHSVFGPQMLDEALQARVQSGDIHPTGPMWGAGELRSADAARMLEASAVLPHASICKGLADAGLRQERRALRVQASEFGFDWLAEDVLQLRFFLRAGAYATALLFALGDVQELAPERRAET
ncbi:MAG: tRNA pseudouridine(13) synthase TruD [Pseudomarimonas sp.]